MGELGKKGNIGEQRTPGQNPFHQPFQSPENIGNISGNRRKPLHPSGANRQFTQNELSQTPNVPKESGYTRAVRHDLYIQATDKGRTIALSEDICSSFNPSHPS